MARKKMRNNEDIFPHQIFKSIYYKWAITNTLAQYTNKPIHKTGESPYINPNAHWNLVNDKGVIQINDKSRLFNEGI